MSADGKLWEYPDLGGMDESSGSHGVICLEAPTGLSDLPDNSAKYRSYWFRRTESGQFVRRPERIPFNRAGRDGDGPGERLSARGLSEADPLEAKRQIRGIDGKAISSGKGRYSGTAGGRRRMGRKECQRNK